MVEFLCILGLGRRLLSVDKLVGRGMTVAFLSSSCFIWSAKSVIESDKKMGKLYFQECEKKATRLVE